MRNEAYREKKRKTCNSLVHRRKTETETEIKKNEAKEIQINKQRNK